MAQNFCGDYGNALWDQGGCSANAPTCSEFVAKNPDAFTNAYVVLTRLSPSMRLVLTMYRYWDIKYIDAYQYQGSPGQTTKTANQPTTTTTMTSYSTKTVTVGGSEKTLIYGPGVTGCPTNPIKIDDFSYLGCFGSSSGFKSFEKVADQPDMSLEGCVKLCKGKKFAGVFGR